MALLALLFYVSLQNAKSIKPKVITVRLTFYQKFYQMPYSSAVVLSLGQFLISLIELFLIFYASLIGIFLF